MTGFACLPLWGVMTLSACISLPNIAQTQMLSDQIGATVVATLPEISVRQDWQILCSPDGCQAEPRNAGSPDISLTILQDSDGQVMILRAPLGLLLGEGVAVTVDGRALGRLAFLTCEPDGCVAPVRLDGALSRAMRGGTAMTLTLIRRDGREITGDYSLLGLTAAMNILGTGSQGAATTP